MVPQRILLLLGIQEVIAEEFPPNLTEGLKHIDFILRNGFCLKTFALFAIFTRNHMLFHVNKNALLWIKYFLRKMLEFSDVGFIIIEIQILIFF
jgi:hypothetical protein